MSTLIGGDFLITETPAKYIFTVEDFSEEQKMLRDSAREFIDREVIPHHERFEKKDYQLTEEKMRQLGELGLLGVDRKSTRLNSSHVKISYAVFCLKKKNNSIQM